jgi:hypothetical protein
MKKSILTIGQKLSKSEQRQISGGGNGCRQQGVFCCERFGGFEFCDPGVCETGLGCTWF